jgi:hypothetical protein
VDTAWFETPTSGLKPQRNFSLPEFVSVT